MAKFKRILLKLSGLFLRCRSRTLLVLIHPIDPG